MAGNSKTPKVPPHPLVEALNPDPTKPPQQALKLIGLPGASPEQGNTRLWLDAGLTSYADIPDDAILYSKTLPDDAGTVLWVAADASITHGSVSSHETQASFLAGGIAASYLAGAAGAAGVGRGPQLTPPTFPSVCVGCPTHFAPCVSLPICPSEAIAPSHCAPCQTPGCPRVSFPICQTEACPPSQLGPCHSSPLLCRTTLTPPCPTHAPINCQLLSQDLACRPSLACHSVHLVCPAPSTDAVCHQASVQVICPTPTAIGRCPSEVCPSHPPCPSVAIPCQSAEVCPSAFCPSIQCGGQFGGGGQAQ
ncbi:MAG TPA: hypothetical protein VIJ33_01800 [Solirubrobacteraceae bacterium]